MTSVSPELSKPAVLAGSAGNSRLGRMSTPVRSRTVLSYSALLSRRARTTPGSPSLRRASSSRAVRNHSMTWCAHFVGRPGRCLCRRHLLRFKLLKDHAPPDAVLRGVGIGEIAFEIKVGFGGGLAVALDAVLLDEWTHVTGKTTVQGRGAWVSRPRVQVGRADDQQDGKK